MMYPLVFLFFYRYSSANTPTTAKFTQMNEFMIRGKFASLLEFVQSKLHQRLGAEKIKHELRLFVIRLFDLPESSIPISSDVAVIFEAMRSLKLLSYLNTAGFEQIIQHFCESESETESKMEQYKKDQSGFEFATKIKDFVPKARSKFPYGSDEPASELQPKQTPAYLTELTMILKRRVAAYHLKYLRELWKLLSNILSLPPLYLLLDAIIMNSILVVWLIPTHMVPEATEKAKQSADFFRKYPILKVTIGDECVYSETKPTGEWSKILVGTVTLFHQPVYASEVPFIIVNVLYKYTPYMIVIILQQASSLVEGSVIW